jgi:hypothetical protein
MSTYADPWVAMRMNDLKTYEDKINKGVALNSFERNRYPYLIEWKRMYDLDNRNAQGMSLTPAEEWELKSLRDKALNYNVRDEESDGGGYRKRKLMKSKKYKKSKKSKRHKKITRRRQRQLSNN